MRINQEFRERPDPEIARVAVVEIRNQLPKSWQNIKIVVRNGRVTLEGMVSSDHERTLAAKAVRLLTGVKSVENHVVVRRKGAAKKVAKAHNP